MTLPVTVRRASVAATLAAITVGGVAAAPAYAAGTTSQASSQSVYLNLLGGAAVVQASNPKTSSIYDGTQSANVVSQSQPPVTVLGQAGITFASLGVASEYSSADTDGSSFACTAISGSGATVQIGSPTVPCSFTAGNVNGGITLDLGAIPGIGGLLSSIANVQLHLNAIDSYAGVTAGGTPIGAANVTGGTVTVTLLGLVSTGPINLTIPTAPNSNLLTSVVTALTGVTGLSALVDALSNAVAPVLNLTTNYQTITAGAFSVSALHVGVLGNTAVANLATSTVGPNAVTPAGSVFPTKGLPITAGGALVAAALITPWYRRRRRLTRTAG